MINTFVYPNYKNFFKILSKYLQKEYKENLNLININIKTREFEKLINFFQPNKITYESIVFYNKPNEPIKEMVNSDFNLFIFKSTEEMKQEIENLKQRDLNIISEYLNSKAIAKNPTLKPKINEVINYIEKIPFITLESSVNVNFQYKEIITLLSLVSIKKSVIIIDSDYPIEIKNGEIIISYPLSLLSELIEINAEEIEDFIKLYNLPQNLEEKINQIVENILNLILSHWVIFYTGNKKEVKQYLVPINTDVLAASEKIHTEIAKKFIQAEVCNIKEMIGNKLPPFKTYGKTYIVQNHDYLLIKTS